MLDLALKLCPVIVYVYNNIYEAGKEKWWTLERVGVGGVVHSLRGGLELFSELFF
jgi:hypothetical protein